MAGVAWPTARRGLRVPSCPAARLGAVREAAGPGRGTNGPGRMSRQAGRGTESKKMVTAGPRRLRSRAGPCVGRGAARRRRWQGAGPGRGGCQRRRRPGPARPGRRVQARGGGPALPASVRGSGSAGTCPSAGTARPGGLSGVRSPPQPFNGLGLKRPVPAAAPEGSSRLSPAAQGKGEPGAEEPESRLLPCVGIGDRAGAGHRCWREPDSGNAKACLASPSFLLSNPIPYRQSSRTEKREVENETAELRSDSGSNQIALIQF